MPFSFPGMGAVGADVTSFGAFYSKAAPSTYINVRGVARAQPVDLRAALPAGCPSL
jgi:hypothetical protein